MKPMICGAVIGAFLLLTPALRAQTTSPLPPAPAEQVGMSKPRLDRIHAALQQEVDQAKLPGVVVMVAQG